jgi:hypothetical protein
MTIRKMIEILLEYLKIWSRLRGFVSNLGLETREKTVVSSFRKKVGFRNREESNRKLPSGSPSFFLPYRVPPDPSFSLSRLKLLFALV